MRLWGLSSGSPLTPFHYQGLEAKSLHKDVEWSPPQPAGPSGLSWTEVVWARSELDTPRGSEAGGVSISRTVPTGRLCGHLCGNFT